MRIRKNDTVLVLAGKDKGKRGRVFRVKPADGLAWVEKVNSTKKAMRPKPGVRQAGLIELELPIHLSNLKLICQVCNKPAKVVADKSQPQSATPGAGYPRVCKICQATIE